jgi:hypothetical protein
MLGMGTEDRQALLKLRAEAMAELVTAVHRYSRLASPPRHLTGAARRGFPGRSADAWAAIEVRLWNARQNAVALGAILREYPAGHPHRGKITDDYQFVTDRYNDAKLRREVGRREELKALKRAV